ncbi:MAG: hypothetical protein IPK79_05765 [Vampirovibrionales bacterium]|nr:hypothetical protein [Vampirovibrionales bacterium]
MSNAQTVRVKRQMTVKTLVNDAFRQQAKTDLTNEVRLIENQLATLDQQYQQTLRQIEDLSQQGHNVSRQLEGLNQEAQGKRSQLTALKMEVSKQLSNLDKVANGAYVITGVLESYVDIAVGENLYEKVQNCELLVEDGVIREIHG